MAIKMVREPSDTPNINNIDDIVPMRYAYGNQNGFVIGKGNEISNSVSGLNFTVNSGRLVLQGVECDIDATGVTITIDNIATKRYYTIYLEVNLGLNTATIKSEYDTATYPTIDAGDDLTENTTGVARLPLYQFTATSGIIGEVNKVVESVKYAKDIKVNNAFNSDNADKVNNLEIKESENNLLQNSDNIIPQLKLLYDGDIYISETQGVLLNSNNIESNAYLLLDIETSTGKRMLLSASNSRLSTSKSSLSLCFVETSSEFSPTTATVISNYYYALFIRDNSLYLSDSEHSSRSSFKITNSISNIRTERETKLHIHRVFKIIF